MYSVDTALTAEFGSLPGWPFTAPHSLGFAGQGQLLSGSLSENSHVLRPLSGRESEARLQLAAT